MGTRGPKSSFSDVACPYEDCAYQGKCDQGNVVGNGTKILKQSRQKVHYFICRACGRSFSARKKTSFYNLKIPEERTLSAVVLLLEGKSIRHVASTMNIKSDTIRAWLLRFAHNPTLVDKQLKQTYSVKQRDLNMLWNAVKNKRFSNWQKFQRRRVKKRLETLQKLEY